MVCYLQGVTPSSGNVQDSAKVSTTKNVDLQKLQSDADKRKLELKLLQQQERFRKLSNEAKEKLDSLRQIRLQEVEAKLEMEKQNLKAAKYSEMSTHELQQAFLNAKKYNLPCLVDIQKEVDRRIAKYGFNQ